MCHVVGHKLAPVHHDDGQLMIRIINITDGTADHVNRWQTDPIFRSPDAVSILRRQDPLSCSIRSTPVGIFNVVAGAVVRPDERKRPEVSEREKAQLIQQMYTCSMKELGKQEPLDKWTPVQYPQQQDSEL